MAGLSKNPKQIGWRYTATEAESRHRWWLWSEHIWFKILTFVWSVHLINLLYENWFLVDSYSVCIYLPWQYIIKTETLKIWIYIQPQFKENVSRKYLDLLKKKIDKILCVPPASLCSVLPTAAKPAILLLSFPNVFCHLVEALINRLQTAFSSLHSLQSLQLDTKKRKNHEVFGMVPLVFSRYPGCILLITFCRLYLQCFSKLMC